MIALAGKGKIVVILGNVDTQLGPEETRQGELTVHIFHHCPSVGR